MQKPQLEALAKAAKRILNDCYSYAKKLLGRKSFSRLQAKMKSYINKEFAKNIWAQTKETTFNLLGHERLMNLVNHIHQKTVHGIAFGILGFFALSAAVGSNLNFGYRIVCDGKTVGFSETKAQAELAFSAAKDELFSILGEEPFEGDVRLVFTIANEELFQSADFLQNSMVAAYDGRADGYGIFVDGSLIVALNSNEDARAALDQYKKEFAGDHAQGVSFNKKVDIQLVRVSTAYIKPVEEAVAALKMPKEGITKHVVAEGETISAIARKYNSSAKKIMNLNPNVKPETMQIGQELIVSDTTPVVAVQTTEQLVESEKIAYPVNKTDDSSTFKGVTIVTKEGIEGIKEVVYDVTRENGVIVSKKAVAETVVQEPVTQEVKVGVKARPSTAPTGTFSMPYYGVLTSRYGRRGRGFHTGIDLAGKVGDSVSASDGGTVSFAGWSGSYGKMVKITHDSGYETYYAHLSSINVSVGQKVSKKQLIGRVGNTGNSTGPHLHFEIRRNGSTLNPSSYLR